MFNNFNKDGAHFLVDGQFGSTGKGLLAAWVAKHRPGHFTYNVSNAGPNSGHTSYAADGEKVVLKQLPTLAVLEHLNGDDSPEVILSAGAVINPDILLAEMRKYPVSVSVDGRAAIIRHADVEAEHSGSIARVAGTRMGVGAAQVRKLSREPDAVAANHLLVGTTVAPDDIDWMDNMSFVEVSQGFSLGLNSRFYPKVTSRECTVMQAAADARIPAAAIGDVCMCIRTYPIRVGNHEGHSSGDWYPDQKEISWADINQQPELTTVTQRVRRVATFSHQQLSEALRANRPTLLLLNFLNYLPSLEERQKFVYAVVTNCEDTLGYIPKLLYGYGPKVEDVAEVVL